MGEAGLRLQIGMLLRVRAVHPFHAHIRLGKAGLNIPAAQAMGDEQIRPSVPPFWVRKVAERVRMQRLRVGCQRLLRVGDDRQLFVLDVQQPRRGLSLRRSLGHNQRHLIPFPAHDLRLRRTPQPAQHRLIRHHQPIFVHRHVRRRQNCHDALHRRRPGRIHTDDARVGHARENDLQPRLVGQVNISGIGSLAGHLFRRVKTGYAATDCTHQKTSVLELFLAIALPSNQ